MRKQDKNPLYSQEDRPLDGVFLTRHATYKAYERHINPSQVLKQMKSQEKNRWKVSTGGVRVATVRDTPKAITVYRKNKKQMPLPPHRTPWCCPMCGSKSVVSNKEKHEDWHKRQEWKSLVQWSNDRFATFERLNRWPNLATRLLVTNKHI